MATQIVPASTHAVDQGTTAPLPQSASTAVARIESRFPLVQAATVYETAAIHAVQLAARAEADGTLSDLDADSLAHAEDLMAGARAELAKAGRLDLIGGAA